MRKQSTGLFAAEAAAPGGERRHRNSFQIPPGEKNRPSRWDDLPFWRRRRDFPLIAQRVHQTVCCRSRRSRGERRHRNSFQIPPGEKTGHPDGMTCLFWRRRRDLNPRGAFYTPYSLSRGAPSATWVLLRISRIAYSFGGESGIRTHGCFHIAGFQDRCYRPLSHLSVCKSAGATLSNAGNILS